jgi:5-methylcytosine-specific restriction endonuclease McrA
MFLVDMMDDPKEATLDHIVPSCRGGSNKVSNIIMCCRKCNEERGHAEFEEYLSRVFFAHSEFERAKLESRYDIYVTQLSI